MAKKMDKEALLEAINKCADLTREQKADLCELVGEQRKYGLVWEDTPENVYEELRTEIPIMREDKSKAIINSDTAPNHIIIEGDNYKALTNLCYTHAGAIDVIYIDPPYNTGKKDFSYNDSFVDKNNGFRHSKWLSFMEKRLRLAKELLADTGVIFISIDDNEQSQLKMLCDEVFGEGNFVRCLSWQANPGGNKSDYVETTIQYVLVYCRNKAYLNNLGFYEKIDASKYPFHDEYGYYKKGSQLEKWGNDDTIHTHPNLAYSIYYSPSTEDVKVLFDYNQEELNENRTCSIKYLNPSPDLINKGYVCIRPRITNVGEGGRWRMKPKTFFERLSNKSFIFDKQARGYRIYEKDRSINEKFMKAKDFIPSDIAKQSADDVVEIFGSKVFSYPKPVSLLKYLLFISSHKHSAILDFFAGSGTTLHAVMALNKEDGGDRKCILVNTNEGKICEDVTYLRNKKVIEGYTTLKGERVEGLKENNLRYFRMEKEQRQPLQRNREALAAAMVDMLRMKHNVYTQRDRVGALPTNPPTTRYYEDRGHGLLILMDSVRIGAMVKAIKEMSFGENAMQKIEVYVYSDGAYAYDDDFLPVKDRVNLHALPAPFLEVFRRVAPKP